jgi:hypothetical protein
MGIVKAWMMEMEELGLSGGDGGLVCADCLNDTYLGKWVTQNATNKKCTYCGKGGQKRISVNIGDLSYHMAGIINQDWADPANELPYDGREGGYQGQVFNPWELLDEIGFEPVNWDILDHIASNLMGHDWCRKNYFETHPEENLLYGWNDFCKAVCHSRRFTFWTDNKSRRDPEDRTDPPPPRKMLREIRRAVEGLHMLQEVPVGTVYWRAREKKSLSKFTAPSDFTSPPVEFALQPNRMSPAGIPMFYGAEAMLTAAFEVEGGKSVTKDMYAASFETLRPLKILDLYCLRRASYFSTDTRDLWHRARFLEKFSAAISKPIDRDKRLHIDYVPSQVFTEYVRYEMCHDKSIDGIRYPSSIDNSPCVVLFFEQEDCMQMPEGRLPSLRYVKGTLQRVSKKPKAT